MFRHAKAVETNETNDQERKELEREKQKRTRKQKGRTLHQETMCMRGSPSK